jgi:hypothetical protein
MISCPLGSSFPYKSSSPGARLRVQLLLELSLLDLVFYRPDFLLHSNLLLIWFSRRADLGSRSCIGALRFVPSFFLVADRFSCHVGGRRP